MLSTKPFKYNVINVNYVKNENYVNTRDKLHV